MVSPCPRIYIYTMKGGQLVCNSIPCIPILVLNIIYICIYVYMYICIYIYMQHFFQRMDVYLESFFQGGINFGPGWRVQLETEISPEFRREVLGEETPALPRVPRAPSASVPSVEEPEETLMWVL